MDRIALYQAPGKAYLLLFVVAFLIPCLIVLAGWRISGRFQGSAQWVVVAVSAIATGALAAAMCRHTLQLSPRGIEVRSTFYSKSIAWQEFEPDVAIIRLSKTPASALTLRTNGVALPGLRSGWFRTGNGSRAFVWITTDDVVRLTTRSGCVVLLSVADPARLRDALRARIHASRAHLHDSAPGAS